MSDHAGRANAWVGPVPVPDRDSHAFWAGLARRELVILSCVDCGYLVHPPSAGCSRCASTNLEPRVVPGNGRIYSYSVVSRRFVRGVEPPYALAIVELDAQPDLRLVTTIDVDDVTEMAVGLPVVPHFVDIAPEKTLLFYRVSSG